MTDHHVLNYHLFTGTFEGYAYPCRKLQLHSSAMLLVALENAAASRADVMNFAVSLGLRVYYGSIVYF